METAASQGRQFELSSPEDNDAIFLVLDRVGQFKSSDICPRVA